MVRRTPWIGHGPKRVENDCVVINFKQDSLALRAHLLLSTLQDVNTYFSIFVKYNTLA